MALRPTLAIAAAAFAAASAEAAPARAAPLPCVATEAEPVNDPRLRPWLYAACAYDLAEFNRRAVSLLSLRRRDLRIERIERTFGLPEMHTNFDDPMVASYTALLSSAAERDGWRVMLSFGERFFQSRGGPRPRFRGTMRPVLIDPGRRGDIRLSLQWLLPHQFAPTSCLSPAALAAEAKRRGWRERFEMVMVLDAGAYQEMRLSRGGIVIAVPLGDPDGCVRTLELTRES
jgi:hypothetical protein